MQDIFNQIDKVDNLIKAFLVINREEALRQAKVIDTKVKNGEELPPLAGVAVAIKDIIATQGTETTCGSKILKGFIPPYNCLLYTSDAADEEDSVDLGGRRIIKK